MLKFCIGSEQENQNIKIQNKEYTIQAATDIFKRKLQELTRKKSEEVNTEMINQGASVVEEVIPVNKQLSDKNSTEHSKFCIGSQQEEPNLPMHNKNYKIQTETEILKQRFSKATNNRKLESPVKLNTSEEMIDQGDSAVEEARPVEKQLSDNNPAENLKEEATNEDYSFAQNPFVDSSVEKSLKEILYKSRYINRLETEIFNRMLNFEKNLTKEEKKLQANGNGEQKNSKNGQTHKHFNQNLNI
jgi:hypothetical protein